METHKGCIPLFGRIALGQDELASGERLIGIDERERKAEGGILKSLSAFAQRSKAREVPECPIVEECFSANLISHNVAEVGQDALE